MGIYKRGRLNKYNPSSGEGGKPPRKPGEYRILSIDGLVKYVGETINLIRRINEHKRSGQFGNSFTVEWKTADGRSSSNTRRSHERQKIKQHNPPLNKSKGGEGRKPKQ